LDNKVFVTIDARCNHGGKKNKERNYSGSLNKYVMEGIQIFWVVMMSNFSA